ncbi:MAG: hypothetical protein WB870_04395 [Gallionellaceae bacterium]
MKYVAFCDVLGFSNAVLNDFDASIVVYQEFKKKVLEWPLSSKAAVAVYSDSILVVSDDLPSVLHAVNALHWVSLVHDWLIRGGVAYGRYWQERDGENLLVVSDALVRAVALEKSVKIPAVAISEEIILGIEAWVPRFQHGILSAPLLFFDGRAIVNPFNRYWFASAVMRAKELLDKHANHREKYEWFLSLAKAVGQDDVLVPDSALAKMLELGILQDRAELTPAGIHPPP